MEKALHAIYDEANDLITTRDQARARGTTLAAELVADSDAIRTETYQAALVAVVNQVFKDKGYTVGSSANEAALVNALLELGRTYAALNPTEAPDTLTTTTLDFLDSLWRAQKTLNPLTPKPAGEIWAELQKGILALTELLDGVDNPLQALKFINNLVQAATNVESLSDEDALDAQFLRELVAFGFEYVKLNPTTLPNSGVETDAFLATLWQEASGNTPSMRKALGHINDLFEAQDSPEQRLKLLQFETSLLKTAKLVPALQAQIQNPKLLSTLVQLGKMVEPVREVE